jgi:Flp pilus assembly protein TadG
MNMKRNITQLLGKHARDERGVAAIEFALCLTVLLLMFLGSVELTRYILIIQKLEKTVSMITDITTQADPNTAPLTTTTMQQIFGATTDMMKPYAFGADGFVIVTNITKTGTNNPVVNWQYCGGGTLSATSKIGTANGAAATLPAGITMIAGEEIVVGEVFYKFSPITTQNIVPAKTLYRTSIFMPRLGALTAFSSTCP